MSHDLNLRLFSTRVLSTEECGYSTVGDINIDLHRTMLRPDSHVDALARNLRVNVYREREFHPGWCFSGSGSCDLEPCPQGEAVLQGSLFDGCEAPYVIVWGWREDEVTAYYVLLHELGHHALQLWPNREAKSPPEYMEDETRAWEWALNQALIPPTPQVVRLIRERWLGDHMKGQGYYWRAEQFMQELERRSHL